MDKADTPQFPRRENFPHRENFPRTWGSTREMAIELVDELLRLEERTHPRNNFVDGPVTGGAIRKDENSRLALMWLKDLVRELAGWAIDHQIGLVLNGLPGGATTHPDEGYTTKHAEADSHIHEAMGATCDFADPKINRRILAALLRHGPGPFPISIVIEATDALTALDMGETQPFVAPLRGVGQEAKAFSLWTLRYKAVLHVEYFRGMRFPRTDALGTVAEAYDVEIGTVDSWASSVPKKLTRIRPVDDSWMKAIARRAGEDAHVLKAQDTLSDEEKDDLKRSSNKWGSTALARHGSKFQEIRQIKGSVIPFPS